VNQVKAAITEHLQTTMNQLKSENRSRMLKERQNTKTNALEEAESIQRSTLESIDYYMEKHYPGEPKQDEHQPYLEHSQESYQPPNVDPMMQEPDLPKHLNLQPSQHKTPIYSNEGNTLEAKMKAYGNNVAQEEYTKNTRI
jgi:hypothetical protein